MQKKILITGTNGLLGQKLVSLLRKDTNFSLIAASKGPDRTPGNIDYCYESLDITRENEVKTVLNKYLPDVIINTAAMTNVDACESQREECWALNVNAVDYFVCELEKLRHNIKNYNPHFIHLSTDFIFDGTSGPLTEDAQPNPLSYYAESKLAAEKLIAQSNIDWAIARTVLVYGITPNMSRSNIVLWVKSSLEQGKDINVVDDQFRTPTLAEDLANGCALIAVKRATGIFNISGDEFMNIFELANRVAKFWGLNPQLIHRSKSDSIKQPAKRPPVTGFIIEKAKTILGYQPHKLEEGLALIQNQITELNRKDSLS